MKTTLTVKEAIEQGYTMALSEDADYYIRLEDLEKDPSPFNDLKLFLGSKETFKFSISEVVAKQLFEGYIDGQDEVDNEPEQLYEELKNVNWEAVMALINPCFKSNYHSVTDIELINETISA